MTYGSRTPIRQKVRARRPLSSAAAMSSAKMTRGTLESRKMLIVLRRLRQKYSWPSTSVKFRRPTKSPCPPMRCHSWSETYAV